MTAWALAVDHWRLPFFSGRLTARQRRRLCQVMGLALLAGGMAGFMPGAILPPPAGAPPLAMAAMYGYLFGAVPVNGLYSALRIVLGALGLAVASNGIATRLYARCLATLFTAFSVLGCIPTLNTVFGCLPLFGYNVIVHAAAAAVAATIGWAQGETSEVTNRPTPWWLVGVAAKVGLVIALWAGVVALSLFHEITWWYNGPVRPTAAVLWGWVKREVPRYASPTQTLSFLRSHFLGPGMGSDQYVSVSANEIDADLSFIQDSPGCSLRLHLVFRFDGIERLAAYSLDQQPVCL